MRKTRILSLLTGVFLMTASILSLFSCAKQPQGEIVEATLYMGGMRDFYRFHLRQAEEGVLFSADEADDEGRVTFEDRPAPEALLREFRRAAEDMGFADSVIAAKKDRSSGVPDKTMWEFSLTWSDGTRKTTTVRPEGEAEIRAYLSKAARILDSLADEADALDSLSLSASASWIQGSYSFYVREEDGRYLLDALFTDLITGEEEGQWDERRVDVEEALLTAEQMEQIRAAAEEIGLRERLTAGSLRWEKPQADDEEEMLIPLDATTYSASASWGAPALGEHGYGDPDWGALMTVLRDIARSLAS